MNDFTLHPQLEADTHFVADLALCSVRLMNDARYPWLMLVPRRADIREVYELDSHSQHQLWHEATLLGELLMQLSDGEKLNIGTLGNVVSQLHVHVIARSSDDATWPGPVWGVGRPKAYDNEALTTLIDTLRMKIAELPTYSF
ncbi:HIT domain-containing protein [Cobetia marina]|uniref:HIT domain-containing protein n=1 Tax=Cobetia marina TaxID=28258 RepID=UPI0010AE1B72|nr:HIT family protein [Cobetia marina]TKD62182.1 HIT domain-containing protein [Cobetia marina]